MALINTSVPNLIQGVSQQSDATRFAGQCEEQENALSSVADGLKKRPNTRHIARLLTSAIGDDSFVHFINRSDSEKYVVIVYKEYDSNNAHTGCKMRAFNVVDGTEASINSTTGGYAISSSQFEYLHTGSPKDNLKALTIADRTFLLNTSKPVSLKNDSNNQIKTTPVLEKKALIFIKQADYEKEYGVKITSSSGATITIGSGATANVTWAYNDVVTGGGRGSTVYRRDWYIASASVQNGGSNYSGTPTLQFTGVTTQTAQDVTFSITSGAASGVATVINQGLFTGVGTYSSGSTYYGNAVTYNGYYAPSTASGYEANIVDANVAGAGSTVEAVITSASSSSATGTELSTETIIDKLHDNGAATDIDTKFSTAFHIKRTNNLIEMVRKDGTDFQISGFDGLANEGLGVIYKEVNSISDLPTFAPDGFVVKVRGDVELSEDDYYVKFETNTGISTDSGGVNSKVGKGSWVETVAPSISSGVSSSTLPISLVSTGVNSFTLQETQFSERLVGDDNSNPLPSFVSQTIKNIFFFKNRLGFLSNENVIISESGLGGLDASGDLVFNFGRTSVTALLDSDPIDVSVSSSRVTNLKSAKGFQENLILFSENGQFVLKGGDILTPKTVSITPITNFSFEDQVDPLPLGSYIYFPFTRGAFTGMREFTVNATTDNYDSTEVTEHVPAYIPKNIIDMAGTTSEDMIVLLSGDEKGSLYIYNYFWNNNQKVLSAWSKFTFTGEIRGIEFIESTLYAVITNGSETNLVEMPLESGLKDAAGFVTHLDMRVASTVTNGSNQITLPYTPADNSAEVYTTDGLKLNCTNSGATVTLAQAVNDVDANGNDIDTNVFVGVPYTMKYTFSEQLFKAKSGNGTSPSNAAKLLIRNGSIYFDETAFFKVKVTPKFRNTYENVFTPDVVGSTVLGTLNLDSGFYRFPVLTKAQDTTITIENDSALPSNFQSAEFESFVHSRSNRYG